MRQIAMTDIHGCYRSFTALLEQVGLSQADELYLLGDYIDRGPGSREVLDVIFDMQALGYKVQCLRGNHEDGFNHACQDRHFFEIWYRAWGGMQTLRSFGVSKATAVPLKYRQFMQQLPYVLEVGEYILVHAGLNFQQEELLKSSADMLYLRDWYDTIDYGRLGGRIILHGHTIVARDFIENQLRRLAQHQVLDIDNGCYANYIPGRGGLCAFDMTNRKLYFQRNID